MIEGKKNYFPTFLQSFQIINVNLYHCKNKKPAAWNGLLFLITHSSQVWQTVSELELDKAKNKGRRSSHVGRQFKGFLTNTGIWIFTWPKRLKCGCIWLLNWHDWKKKEKVHPLPEKTKEGEGHGRAPRCLPLFPAQLPAIFWPAVSDLVFPHTVLQELNRQQSNLPIRCNLYCTISAAKMPSYCSTLPCNLPAADGVGA